MLHFEIVIRFRQVIKTLRSWGIRIDEALFLGGKEKGAFLKNFGADIFLMTRFGIATRLLNMWLPDMCHTVLRTRFEMQLRKLAPGIFRRNLKDIDGV